MSSPSSSGSGKRKRASLLAESLPHSSTADLLQPSSRDASGEDAADPAPQLLTSNKHKRTTAPNDLVAFHKRPRTKSNPVTEDSVRDHTDQLDSNVNDAYDSNTEKAPRSKRRMKASPTKEIDERAMPPPPKGVLQDPVGYHTNPPPTGRAVRVYADGVFDLFHLGYVLVQSELVGPNLNHSQAHASTRTG